MQRPTPESLPSSVPSKGETDEYEFQYIDPEQHGPLLRAITLHSKDVTYDWMVDLDRLITEDNSLQNEYRRPVDNDQVNAIRSRFERKLGLLEPDHPLATPYARARKYNRNLPVPENIINIMSALSEIGGSVESGISLAQTGHNLLWGTGKNYPLAARHIGYLAGVLGWKGEPLTIIKEVPGLFRASVARRSLLARLAMVHGKAPQQGLNTDGIRQLFANPNPEQHLMALLLRGEHYTFGQVFRPYRKVGKNGPRLPWTARQESYWIYDQLRDPHNVELIGSETVRAYLHYKDPKGHALEAFPHLRQYLPARPEPPPPAPRPTRHDLRRRLRAKRRAIGS